MFKKKVLIDENSVAALSRNIFYIREEKNDYYSINDPSTKYPNYKMLNSSAAFVITQIDGKKTVGQITKNLMQKYKISSQEYDTILKDVESIMGHFQDNRIINWNSEINYIEKNVEVGDSFVISVAKEEEIREIKKYLDEMLSFNEEDHEKFIRYISPILRNKIKDNNLVSFTVLRQMIFLYDYILLIKKDVNTNAIVGLIAFTISHDFPQAIKLEYLFNTQGDVLDFFDLNVINKIKRMAVEDVRKIRIFVNDSDKNIEVLKQRFKKVGVLEKELGSNDLYIYDMNI